MTLVSRYWVAITTWIVLILLLAGLYAASVVSPYRATFLSGWLLFVCILALVMYNLRNRLSFVSWGASVGWFQFHVSAGLLTLALFVVHIGLRVPNGLFEVTLTLLYAAGAVSGFVGLTLLTVASRRLVTGGEEVSLERIPIMRERLREKIEAIVERAVSEDHSTILADFYDRQLAAFLDEPRNRWGRFLDSPRSRRGLLTDLESLSHDLGEKEREKAEELRVLIHAKDDLDYQQTLRGTLKYWLFIHVPVAYCLLIFSLVHAIVVSAYTTGVE